MRNLCSRVTLHNSFEKLPLVQHYTVMLYMAGNAISLAKMLFQFNEGRILLVCCSCTDQACLAIEQDGRHKL